MNKALIIKIIVILLFLLLSILALTIAYFLNIDIETKEPKEIKEECEINTYLYKNRKVFTIENKNQTENIKYILYFHGGSYVAEATQNHWDFLGEIVKDTNYTVIMPDYPLTPKHNYKDVYNMVEPLYKKIVEKVGQDNLIIMGDSAGGGLALGLYEKMANENLELPVKTILISPWLDVRLENEKIKEIEKADTVLNKEALKIPLVKSALTTFLFFSYIELTTGLWISSYFVYGLGISKYYAALITALFYGSITAGRIITGLFSNNFENYKIIRAGETAIIAGCILMIFGDKYLSVAGAFIIGIGSSPVYPAMLHETPKRFGEKASLTVMGLQMSVSYTGGAIAPLIFGMLADKFSFNLLPFYILFGAVIIFISSEYLNRSLKKYQFI